MNTLPPSLSAALPDRQARSRADALHDAGLVLRFNTGDETAFNEIVARYRTRMLRAAFGLLRNQADAEEIAQDTFIRAHRALARFRGESSLAVWLHCIALNLSRNRHWYFFRRKRHLTDSLDRAVTAESATTFADLLPSNAPDPVRLTVRHEFATLVAGCMARLSAPQREILHLRNSQQKSYTSIAQALGIKRGTVKSRVARARKNLRTLLQQAYVPGRSPQAEESGPWFETMRPTGQSLALSA